MIQLPVRYDRSPDNNQHIFDAEGRVIAQVATWQYNWPAQGGKPDDEITPEHGHAVAEQIVTALNRDDGARIAELKTALQWIYNIAIDPHPEAISNIGGIAAEALGEPDGQ